MGEYILPSTRKEEAVLKVLAFGTASILSLELIRSHFCMSSFSKAGYHVFQAAGFVIQNLTGSRDLLDHGGVLLSCIIKPSDGSLNSSGYFGLFPSDGGHQIHKKAGRISIKSNITQWKLLSKTPKP